MHRLAWLALSLIACAPEAPPPALTPPPPPAVTVAPEPAEAPPPEPPRPVCEMAAPAPPSVEQDGRVLRPLTEHPGRLHLLTIEGRTLLVGARTSKPLHFSSGGHRWTQPGGSYRNEFFVLEGDTIRPEPALEKGLWDDQDLWAARGRWPRVDIRTTNYGNTAWESVKWRWTDDHWEHQYNDDTVPWRGGYVGWRLEEGERRFVFEPSAEALGLPPDLCSGEEACKPDVVVASPRDLYVNADGCSLGSYDACTVTAVLHWCAPADGFRTYPLPEPVEKVALHAVPGTLLVVGSRGDGGPLQQVLRDGAWTTVEAPEPNFEDVRIAAAGAVLWYLGDEGLYQLQAARWQRVARWELARPEGKRGPWRLRLPDDATEYIYTGLAAGASQPLLVSAVVAPPKGVEHGRKTVVFTTEPAAP